VNAADTADTAEAADFSPLLELSQLDLAGKRVLIREDYNVPLTDGQIGNDARIQASLPTLRQVLQAGASVLVVSHLGRPVAGRRDEALSLRPVAERLSKLLGCPVRLQRDWLDGAEASPGEVVLCENVRFQAGETDNEDNLARRMAALCHVFVNDAFAVCHRRHASVYGIVKYAPVSCAGPLLLRELQVLSQCLEAPGRPLVAVVGGAKLESKLGVLQNLLRQADRLVAGGAIGNARLAAAGHGVGASLAAAEKGDLEAARTLLAHPRAERLLLPADAVCARHCREDAESRECRIAEVADDEIVLDWGPRTRDQVGALLRQAGTILWSGPPGVFEMAPFSAGTRLVVEAIAQNREARSIAGGGNTLEALARFGAPGGVSFASTGGGAFLHFLERGSLPCVNMLMESARAWTAMERGREL